MQISVHAPLRRALLAGTILGSLSAGHALAQNATWTGATSSVFHDSSNWNPNGAPSGTAFFDNAGRPAVTINSDRTLAGLTFNRPANSYIISNHAELRFSGSGIINNSGQIQIIDNRHLIYFQNSAAAGATTIINGSAYIFFKDTSTAGAAAIYNNPDGRVVFEDNSTAGSATIANGKGASVSFIGNSTAGNATIRNNPDGSIGFAANATAGNATIDNSGRLNFFETSSGGNATIRNNADGFMQFVASSTAGNATIDNSGTLLFWLNASAGNARLITNAGGETFFNGKSHDAVGSIAGAGNYVLSLWSLTTGGNGDTTEVSGVISGGGALIKAGAGTLTLSGANTYTGATTVNGGRLVVNGSLASAVTVNGGATLGGSGSVGGIAVASGGAVAPGNSIGALSVAGNVAFAAGSTYQVEINAAGQGDRIAATGMATLSGGTVQVLAEAGNYAAGTRYTILTANGGVTGQFAGVSSNLAFLTPTLVHGASDVTLTMTRNDTGFGPDGGGGSGGGSAGGGSGGGSGGEPPKPGGGGATGGGGSGSGPRPYIAATRNQGFIANAAERLGVGNPIYDTLVSATAAEARAGFDLLSGEAHAQGVAVAVGESRLVREAVLGRLRGSLLPVPGGEVAAGFSADLPSAKGPVAMPAPRLDERFSFWGEGFGAHANTDGDGNAASLSRRTGGAILGADMKLYDSGASSLRVGIAGGYTRSDFDVDTRLSSGRLESGHVLLYAGARHGNWRLDGGVGYSFGETNLTRQVLIRGFGNTLRSERDTDLLQAFAELGYAFRFQGFALEPFAQLALLRVSSGSAIEQGGAAALRVASQDQSLGFTTLGLRAEAQLGAMPLFARGLVGWRYGFGDLTPQAGTAFVAGITPARVYAAQIDRNALVAEAGLDWRATASTTVGIAYSAAIGERTRDHALKGRLEVRF